MGGRDTGHAESHQPRPRGNCSVPTLAGMALPSAWQPARLCEGAPGPRQVDCMEQLLQPPEPGSPGEQASPASEGEGACHLHGPPAAPPRKGLHVKPCPSLVGGPVRQQDQDDSQTDPWVWTSRGRPPPWEPVPSSASLLRPLAGAGRPHPVPTPESWRPARNARRPGGRLAKFRVPLQETESYVPGSGKPVSLGLRVACKSPPRRLGRLCRLNSCSVSLQF